MRTSTPYPTEEPGGIRECSRGGVGFKLGGCQSGATELPAEVIRDRLMAVPGGSVDQENGLIA
jgi:hypothetical protein